MKGKDPMTTTTTTPDTGITTWTIDAAHSLVEFSARHLMITNVKGRLPALAGSLSLDEGDLTGSSVTVEFDPSRIDTSSAERDAHLRSGDFLEVEQYPTITFRSTAVEGGPLTEGAALRVTGELSIHGVTRPVTLDATFEGRGPDPWGGERLSFSARTTIDRRDFGLTWNAALETGGVVVSNEIKVAIELQAVLTP